MANSDSRAVGSDRELHLPKDWCEKQGVEPGEDEVVVYEQEDGSLEVIPPERD
jgi:hypothetical protein